MNKIRRNWLGRGSVMALVAAGLIGLGACSGNDGLTKAEEDALQERVTAAEEARRLAEQQRLQEQQRRQQAEQRNQQEQQQRQQAEQERDAAEEERDEAQQTLDRFVALEIVEAIPETITTADKEIISVSPLSYGEAAPVTATGATFTSTNTGSSAGWFRTTRSGSSEQRRDFAEIFSNVEAPFREDFRDHSLGSTLTYDTNGRVLGADNHINITTPDHGMIAASTRFPRPSTHRQGEIETFTVTDRGPNAAEKQAARDRKDAVDALNSDTDPNNDVVFANDPLYDDYRLAERNTDRYPERYSVDISGTLMGAPGTFRCAGAAAGGTCTVDLSGPNDYVFGQTGAEWQFIPTNATSQVIIPDAEYMWFGWWKREPIETTPNADAVFDYAANYGGTNEVADATGATGSATYEGAAIGYYGFYDIEAAEDDRSRAGRFQAKATLIADFDADTLSGSITEFDTEPTWAVTLQSRPIATGAVAVADDTVSWSIRGLPRDGGHWEAQFYSNFEAPADTAQPTGVAGAFTAQYGAHRKMVGAFGAERD